MKYHSSFNHWTKLVLVILVQILNVNFGFSQIANNYIFTPVSGTFSTISGSGSLVSGFTDNDDSYSSQIPIGFSFPFNGSNYTSCYLNTNGHITFNTIPTTNTTNMRSASLATADAGLYPMIAAYKADLQGPGTYPAYYQTTGTAPNRVFTVELPNWSVYLFSASSFSIQIKLYEANGQIDIVYDNLAGTQTTTAAIGIAQSSSDYYGLNNTSNAPIASATTAVITAAGKPAAGQIYRFAPPVPMSWTSATTTQPLITPIPIGSSNNVILSMPLTVAGTSLPYAIRSFNLSTNGTTNPTDIASAKIYYTGTSSSFNTSSLFGSISNVSGAYSITGSQILPGAGTYYFWLVYDIASNASNGNIADAECFSLTYDSVAVNRTYNMAVTAPVGSRTIAPRLNGTYTVGAGGNYATITAAANDLNLLGVSGPVILSLTNSTYNSVSGEVFPINFTSVANACPTCGISTPLVTIRPASSNPGVLISDNNAVALFNVSNPYIQFDGRAGGVGSAQQFTLVNNSTTGTVFTFQNEATGSTIRNCVVKSANSSTTSGAIVIGGTAALQANGAVGNDSITITNNFVGRHTIPGTLFNAVYVQGQSASLQNDYGNITNNNFFSFVGNGIFATSTNTGVGSGWTITGNSFYDSTTTTSTNSITAINWTPAGSTSFNHVISGNYIGGSAPLAAGNPWTFSALSGGITGIAASTSSGVSPTLIQSNIIQNIALTGGATSTFAFTGINTSGSGTYTIGGSALTGNTIGHNTNISSIRSLNNSAVTGITNSGTGIINISNNIVAGLTDSAAAVSAAIRGINNGGGSVVTVSNNTLHNFYTQSTNTGTTTAAAVSGIAITSAGNPQVVSGNNIGGAGMLRNVQSAAHVMNGILYAGTSVNMTLQNNTVTNLVSASTALGTTSTAAVNGILMTSGSTLTNITNNTVTNITLSGAATNQVNGMCVSGSGTTTNITNNTFSFIRNTLSTSVGTLTGAAINGFVGSIANTININGNLIDSLTYSGTSGSLMNGIYTAGFTGSAVSQNTVTRLRSSSTSIGATNAAAIVGININSTGLNLNVSRNIIHSIVSTATTTAANLVGMYFTSSSSNVSNTTIVARNQIHSFSLATTAAGGLSGIVVGPTFATVQNNLIRLGVNASGSVLSGPYVNRGILLSSSTYGATGTGNGLRLYHNTIYLNGSYTSLASSSYGIDHSFAIGGGNVDIRNNIIANFSSNAGGTGFHVGMRLVTATNINANFNLYFTPGTGGVPLQLSATNYLNLFGPAGWRLATKLDQSSFINLNPNFVAPLGTSSNYSLKVQSPTPIEGMGDNTITTSDNFDGLSRSALTPVDIGADAGNYTLSADSVAPLIAFIPQSNVLVNSNVTIQASVYDNGGLYTSGTLVPRVYYRKGLNGTWTSNTATLNAGSSRNGQWNFTIDHSLVGGLFANDTIYYYLIAQDSAGNIASNVPYVLASNVNTVAAHPSNTIAPVLNFYKMVPTLTSPVLVGPGNPITSLTAADATGLFFNLNNGSISGNMQVLITGNIAESGATQLNAITQVNNGVVGNYGYRITIQPQNNTQVTLTTASASGLIRLNGNGTTAAGASGITIRGNSPTGGANDTNLVLVCQSTAAPVVLLANDASSDSLVNLVIRGRNTASTGLVSIATSVAPAAGTGNDNNVITGCTFYPDLGTAYATGVSIAGTSGRENDGTVITNNNFYNFTSSGVLGSTATGVNTRIQGNHFYYNFPVALSSAWTSIALTPGAVSNGDTITGNYIGGSARFCGGAALTNTGAVTFNGINCSVGTNTGVYIANNIIQNINYNSASASAMTGITLTSGVGVITGNTIGHPVTANSIQSLGIGVISGINYSGASSIAISNNFLGNLTVNNTASTAAALRGITVSSTSLAVTVTGNTLINFSANTAMTGTTTTSPLCGIVVSSLNTAQQISNNIISNFTQLNSTATSGSVFGIATTGGVNIITNNQVRNITNNSLSTGTSNLASLIGLMNTSTSTGQVISGNLIDSLYRPASASTQTIGIYGAGTSLTMTNNIVRNINSNTTSSSTTTSSGILGMTFPSSTANNNISGNRIFNLNSTNPAASGTWILGIYAAMTTSGANFIQKNFVHSFSAQSNNTINYYGVYIGGGILLTQNNMIRLGIDANGAAYTGPYNVYGIYLATSSANNFYHNSVYLDGSPSSGSGTTASFFISSAAGLVNVRNNIFINNVNNAGSSGFNYAYRPSQNTATTLVSNYNIFSAPNAGGVLVQLGSTLANYASLTGATGWQNSNGTYFNDLNSGVGTPNFVNATGDMSGVDLHLASPTGMESSGDPSVVSIVTDDYDNETRANNSPVDIGADAGNYVLNASVDIVPPVISYTALTNISSVSDRTIAVTITDNRGVNLGGFAPRLYFRKGVNGTYTTATGSLSSGNAANGVWNFTISTSAMGGLVLGDTVFYFVAAQDSAANLSVTPAYGFGSDVTNISTLPVNPSRYLISSPLPTVINVGPGLPMTSLTANDTTGVFYRINNGFLQGNTVINIDGDTLYESGAVGLGRWLEVNGSTLGNYGYTVTIRPGNGGTISRKVLWGSTNINLIRFGACSGVTVTGVANGGNANDTNLVIKNMPGSASSCVQIANDATNIRFQNVVMEGRGSNPLVFIATSTGTTGNDNITFDNCWLRSDTINAVPNLGGIYCNGTTAKENDNITINNCKFQNMGNYGVYMGTATGNNIRITNNHFYFNNPISSYSGATYPIFFTTGLSSNGDTITGNFIGGSGLNCSGTPFINANNVFGGVYISSVGAGTGVYAQGNTIRNIQVNTSNFYGMFAGSGVINFTGNTIGSVTTPNSINLPANAIHYGIYSQTGQNITVAGNTIANLTAGAASTGVSLRGIHVQSGSLNTTSITNNLVSNLTTASTNTGTSTSMALQGIQLTSTSGTQTISGNTIQNLVNTNNTTANLTGAVGIIVTGGTTNITNNTVSSIVNPSSSTSTQGSLCAAVGIAVWGGNGGFNITNNTIQGLQNLPIIPVSSQVVGLSVSSGSNMAINGNTIRNLTTNSVSASTLTAAPLVGLSYYAAGTNNTISQNTIHSLQLNTTAIPVANALYGLYYSNSTAGSNWVTRNIIHSLRNATGGPGLVVGLFNNAGTTTFSNNMIRVGLDSSGTLYNSQLELRGVFNATNTTNNFYHNTIYLGGAPATGGSNTYGYFGSVQVAANNVLNIRNNIFYNAVSNASNAAGFNYAMRLFDSLNVNSNNNIFAATGNGAILLGTAGNYNTLRGAGGWNFVTGLDYNSATATAPFFQNATGSASQVNLRLVQSNPANGTADLGVSVLVGTDIDGQARTAGTPPVVGADAEPFTATTPDIFAPVISYSALGNTGDNIGPRQFTNVTITDLGGIPLTGPLAPRVYYRKGANGTFVSVAASNNTGNANNATFSFNMDYTLISGGVNPNDTIFYYVLAQDNAGNVASNSPFAIASDVNTVVAHPRSAGFYQIFPSIAANTVFNVGVGQTFPTLTGVGGLFDFLNNRSINGNIEARITSNISEPGFVMLSQIGENGVGGYSVTIRPDSLTTGERVLSGTGSVFGLIVLNGADRVKVSGIPAVTGAASDKKLRIRNSGTTTAAVYLMNDAIGNRFSNVIVEGATISSSTGVIQFGISNRTLGNSNDTITGCVIRNDQTFVLPNGVPIAGIYSNSTISALNANNTITNNELLNWGTTGVFVDGVNGGNWNISGNSFYNNLSVPTTSASQTAISLQAGIFSNGNTINNNFIGGSSASCGGSPYVNLSTGLSFNAISVNAGISTTSSVNGNTIQNMSLTGGNTANFNGINLAFGKFDVLNNLVGHPTVTNSIYSTGLGSFNGISNSSTDVVNISGNAVQGIFINSGAALNFNGISVSTGMASLTNNVVGHATTANSITFFSSGSFNGIQLATPVSVANSTNVTGNTIANIACTMNANYVVSGLNISGTTAPIITGNTINNISSMSINSGINSSQALVGINFTTGTANPSGTVVSQNTIYTLTAANTSSSAITAVSGMYISAATSPLISRNRIWDLRNLSTSTGAYPPPVAAGINMATPAISINMLNNQISLGSNQSTNTTFIGIWTSVSGNYTVNAYHNTVVITGAAGSGNLASYAFMRGANGAAEVTSPLSLVNNIFFNNRTGGSGSHYAISNQVAPPTVATGANWNPASASYNLLVSANESTVGMWGGAARDINSWRTSSTADNLSYSVTAGTAAGQLNAANLFNDVANCDLSIKSNNTEAWYLSGKAIAGYSSSDFANGTRNTTSGFGVDIGAFEFATPASVPPSATLSGTIGTNNTQVISFANREIGQVTWLGTTGSYPSSLDVKYYTGVNPPSANSVYKYMNSYWYMDATGGSNYTYRMMLTYDDALLGAMLASESNLNLVQRPGSGNWNPLATSSSVNTITNRIDNASAATSFGTFTGSDQCVVIPVISGSNAVCANSVQTYTVQSNSNRTITWTVTGGTVTAGQGSNSATITWGAAGSGTISVRDSLNNSSCAASSDMLNVIINPNPTPAISGVTAICENNSATYSTPTNAGRGYFWMVTGGTIASGQGTSSVNVNWGSAGSGTLTVTDTIKATGCFTTTAAYNVTINPNPTPAISGVTSICANSAAAYSTPLNGGRAYFWSVTGGSIASGQGSNSLNVNWGNAGNATVVVTDTIKATGCYTTTAAYNVVLNPYPTPAVSGSASVCANSTSNYSTPSNTGRGYFWTISGGVINSGQGTTTVNVTWGAAGSGSLTVTDTIKATGCFTTTAAYNVTINPNPTPAISGLTAICANNSATYTTPSNSGRIYNWVVTGGTISSGQGNASVNVAWGAAGTGTLIVKDSVTATGCKTSTAAYNVTINPYPTPVITGSNTVCANSSTPYSIPSNSGRTYVWTVSGGTITSGQGTTNITVAWAGVGLGSVTVSDSVNATGCKTTTSPFTVNINTSPNPVISGITSICQGNSTTYTTPFNSGSAYIWQVSGGNITAGAGTNTITVNWTSLGAGTVVVTDSILAGGCKTTTGAYNVAVNAYPTPVISGPATACINSSQSYSTPNNNGRTYVWTITGGLITSGAGTSSINVTWNTAGTGTLRVSDSVNTTGCKTTTAIYNVLVNPIIASNSITADQIICSGTSASNLTGTTPTGGNGTYSYAWESSTISATAGFAAATGVNNTATYSTGNLTATTWYRRTVSAGVCTALTSNVVQITVNPVIANNAISSSQTICHNTVPAALTGTTPSGGNGSFSYLWESSTTSATAGFSTATGTSNAAGYAPGSLAVTTWYRRTVSAGVCTPLVSTAIKITVQDTTKPTVVTRNITRYLNSSGTLAITGTDVDNGSIDNCGISARTLSKSSFTCANVGANLIYLTVTDLIGNKDSAAATVTVLDTIRPTVVVKNFTAYLDGSGNTSISVPNINNGSTDNCGIQSLVLSKTTFNCSNVGSNVVTLTVTDVNNNVNTANATVTVLDTIKPIVNVTNGIVLYLNASASIPVTTAMINNGSTDNCGILSMSVSPSTITCAHIGITPVTLTVTDVNGNVNSSVTNVVVFDPVVPVARPKARISAYLNSAGNAVINANMVDSASSDNCTITSKVISQSTFNCGHLGDNTISFTVQDQSGNANAANVIVTILDTIKPVLNLQNVTANLNTSGVATITAAMANNGSTDNCGISTMTLSKTVFSCADRGTNTVTFTATDASGNSTTGNVTVTINDVSNPVARARNFIVYLSGAGSASITATTADSASTDNCAVTTRSISQSSFTCANVGNNTVTLTVGDAAGNTGNATFNVLVRDTIRPTVVTQNITAYLGSSGTATITAAQVNNSSSDNCGIGTLSLSKTSFNCSNTGANSVTLTVTDVNGNSNTGNATVTILDTIKPIPVVNNPVTIYLNASGTATLTTTQVNNGSTDNCSISNLSLSKTSFTCADRGNNSVIFTVTDASSNSQTANVTVVVADTTRPVARAKNFIVYLSGTGSASITATAADSASTDNCAVTTRSISQSSFTCANVGNNTVTMSVGDAAGNTGTANFNVLVIDTVRPLAVAQNVTIYLDVNGLAGLTAVQVNNGSTDNCGIASMSLSKTSFNCTNLGSGNVVTLTVNDVNGNNRTANATVTVLDTIRPTVSFNNNLNLYLNATGTATLTTTMVNNGSSDNCSVQSLSLSKTSFTGADRGLNVVTFTVTDQSSNSRSASVNIIVLDTVRPVVTTQNVTLYLNASGTATLTAAQVNNGSTDNVGVTGLSINQANFTCAHIGVNTVTLTVGDASGNSASGNATVTIADTIKPVVSASNATIYLNALGTATLSPSQLNVVATDNCSVASTTLSKTSFDCTNRGANSVVVTVLDGSGNSRTATVTVTALDTIRPTALINNNLNLYLNGAGTATLTTGMVNNGSTDNCAVMSLSLSKTSFTGADRGLNVVNFTVTDSSLNARVVPVNVYVIDSVRPVANAQNVTIYLNAAGTATVTAGQVNNGSADNVGVTSLVLSQTSFTCANTGANNVVLTVADASGNQSTANAVVTVADTIKPVAVAQNLTVYLNALGTASITTSQVNNGSSDNCSVASLSLSKSTFDCSNVGVNSVNFTVADPSNNSRTVVAQITVLDTIRPMVLISNNLNLYLNAVGTATLTTSMVNNGSSDNCSIQNMTLSKTTFTGTDRGTNVVTFTVTDASNNSRAVPVTVFVIDSMRPVAIGQNRTIYLNASGLASVTPAQVNNGSTDNVGVTSLTLSQSNFTCTNVGPNFVNLTVGDASGNTSVAQVVITVIDTIKPTLAKKDLTIYLNNLGSASITTANVNNGSSDNCGIASLDLSKTDFDCSNLNLNNVTFTVEDVNGNISTANVQVTVRDTTRPVVAVNNNLVIYLDGTGNVNLTATEVDNGSYDNCGIVNRVISKTSFNAQNRGSNPITFTATDQSGNSRTVNVNIIVRDTVVPIVRGKDLSIYLNNSGTATITPAMVDNGSSDNVGIKSLTISKSFFNCSNVGDNPVFITVRDSSNNESIGEVNVKVIDSILPRVVSKPSNKVVGFCNDIINYSNPIAADNCSGVLVTQTAGLPSGSKFPVGLTTNTFRIEDASGNFITTSFTVVVVPETVIDTFPSLEMCMDHDTIVFSKGFPNLTFSGPGMKRDKITFDPKVAGAGTHTINAYFADSMGCTSTGSFTVTVYPVPDKPEIERPASNILQAKKEYDFYQWYRDEVLLPGETGRSITVTQAGVYGLVVRNISGCINGSNPYYFGVPIGINTMVKDQDLFYVYPNPTQNVFFIEMKGIDVKGTTITMMDMLGKEVRVMHPESDVIEMNVIDFAPGTYYVKLENGNKFMVKPIVITK